MTTEATHQTTQNLLSATRGDRLAADQLLPLIYDELHDIAVASMRREGGNHTLQPTALIHEAYLRLIDQTEVDWANRAHFFALASEMMRRILVDHARRKKAAKRGGGARAVALNSGIEPAIDDEAGEIDLIALNEALEELGRLNERHRKVVDVRYFGGLSVEETAEVLGVSATTVKADWRLARAWLRVRLADAAPATG